MTVHLKIEDRLNVNELLPEKGSLTQQIQAKSIQDKTQITSEEIEEYEILQDPSGGLKWNLEKARSKEIKFTTGEIELLRSGVNRLDEANEIPLYLVDLCLKVKELSGENN